MVISVISPVSEVSRQAEAQVSMETSTHPPEEDTNSILSSIEEMDIDPLLLSDIDSGNEAPPTTQRGPAPLFLSVDFSLKDKFTGEKLDVSHDLESRSHDIKDYFKEAMPLCMSEFLHTHT